MPGFCETFVTASHSPSRSTSCLTGCGVTSCRLGAPVPHPLQGFTSTPRPLDGVPRFVVPTAVYAAASDWGTAEGSDGALTKRIERAAGELADEVQRAPAVRIADPDTRRRHRRNCDLLDYGARRVTSRRCCARLRRTVGLVIDRATAGLAADLA